MVGKKELRMRVANAELMIILIAITLGMIVLFGGGIFIFKFMNDLILEPIKGGRISAVGLLVLAIFIIMIIKRFRGRSGPELEAEMIKEELRTRRRQRLY